MGVILRVLGPRMDFGEAVEFFKVDEAYLLTTHVNSDGDGLSGILAMSEMLQCMGRRYRIIVSDKMVDRRFRFLSGFDRIETLGDIEDKPTFGRAVFLDTPTISAKRVGDVADLLEPGAKTLVIDHHMGGDEEGDVHVIDPGACAASELVFRMIQAAGVEVSAEMANQIYAGIAFDTKLFKFSHPDRAVKVCAELVDLGADPEAIADAIFARESYETIYTLGMALLTLELHHSDRVCTLLVDHSTYEMGGDLGLVVDHAMAIDGVEVALFFKEQEPGQFRVSLRSRGAVDVNAIARKFDGGGHSRASGCQIGGNYLNARTQLVEEASAALGSADGNG